jgi:hypothetical protein
MDLKMAVSDGERTFLLVRGGVGKEMVEAARVEGRGTPDHSVHLIIQSINQSIRQSINTSINQSASRGGLSVTKTPAPSEAWQTQTV